jgi:predicted deacylase
MALHTGGYGRINMPQLRVDFRVPGAKKFAQAFNVPVILESQPRPGSLRQAAGELGIPVLVYEGGEALRFNELCIRGGVRGIMHVLHYLEILKSSSISSIEKSKSIITNTSRWLRAPVSGLVQPMGDVIARSVKKNDVLAVVHDPFLIKPSVELIAPFEGIVIGQALKAVSTEGDALYHIASFKKIKGVKAFIDEYRDEITTQEG